jgi:hypothetical protein
MRIALGLIYSIDFRLPLPLVGFWKGLAKDVEKAVLGSIGITQQLFFL